MAVNRQVNDSEGQESLRDLLIPDLPAYAARLRALALDGDKAADQLAALKLIHEIIGSSGSGSGRLDLAGAIRATVRETAQEKPGEG